jgi:hypothetical protein
MANPVVPLVFMGLVAFWPQKDGVLHNDFMVAALINDDSFASNTDCNHQPRLVIPSKASLGGPGSLCQSSLGTVTCDLTHGSSGAVEVHLDTHRKKTPFPPKPSDTRQPHKNSADDGGNPWWIVRMGNVEPTSALPDADLSMLIDAELEFGWDGVYVCALDGGDDGKVFPMKFGVAGHTSTLEQAVAEQVMFVSEVTSTSPTLRLVRDGVETDIVLDCSSGVCPALEFSNDVGSKCGEDQHFDQFFHLFIAPKFKSHPERDKTGSPVLEKDVEFDCNSALPKVTAAVRGSASRAGADRTDGERVMIMPRIGPKTGDRIICPPVIFSE